MPETKGAALIVGAGDGTGGAIARRFAQAGHVACVTRRRHADQLEALCARIRAAGGEAQPFVSDAREEAQVVELVARIEREVGPIEVAVFNPGANVNFGILETTARVYFKVWQMACFAGFLVGREVVRRMVPRGRGTILFTGATASTRGGTGFAAFAGAKHGLRALAQSMARELGPKGIHVAHVIIDGMIDTPWVRENFPERITTRPAEAGLLDPDAIAATYLALHQQPRSAWTYELDLRPWAETW